MEKLFVNEVVKENGVTHGIVGSGKTTLDNIKIIFKGNRFDAISTLIENPPAEGFNSFDRFCQFIVLTQFHPTFGLSMKISDFHNDMDAALDEYNVLKGKELEKETRDKLMRLFLEIKDHPKERAELIYVPLAL
jgi:hypothetical protein